MQDPAASVSLVGIGNKAAEQVTRAWLVKLSTASPLWQGVHCCVLLRTCSCHQGPGVGQYWCHSDTKCSTVWPPSPASTLGGQQ